MMQKQKIALIAVIVILSLAAFKTATPAVDASKACLLGYKAFCSFTPVSTLILAMAAIGTFFATKSIVLGGSA
jgi:hypothetical protein